MNKLLLVTSLVVLSGCAQEYANNQSTLPPGCTVSPVAASTTAPNGGALVTCGGSTTALILNGAPGVANSIIQPIQLCSGTPSYPDTFIEVGFCIQNNLYAVYSQNGGFETELIPGAYTSNAIGSRCNFTVLPNCQIQAN